MNLLNHPNARSVLRSGPGNRLRLAGLVFVSIFAILCTASRAADAGRERIRFDNAWRFALGHPSDTSRDFGHATGYFSYLAKTGFGDGPASAVFDDRGWRLVNLPHDWAVEQPFDSRASASHGYRTVGPRFPDTSVGWYRKTFTVPAEDLGRRIRIDLDGAFRNARVFINGFYVGEEPSGYLDASYDLTDYLNYGGENVLSVRVDATMEEGWFYEGAGLYRHVWLTKTHPVHLPKNGTWVRTEPVGDGVSVLIDTEVLNESRADANVMLVQTLLDPAGNTLATTQVRLGSLKPGQLETAKAHAALTRPQLWSLESPVLHKLVSKLEIDGKIVDSQETSFGVRTIRFDPNAGFFLNGKHVILKGTNNHQDHAGVGVALPDALQYYRIKRLKDMGSNAYRCSHNPPTVELLEACDRLGMLVIDENRLMGANPYHLGQLERMMRRDRNHPSIILWSVGNEEWGIEGNIKGARLAQTMQDFVNRYDPTRPATAAISGGWGGINTTIQAIGVNYIKQGDTDLQHKLYPERFILGTEETTTQGTRGIHFDDRIKCHLSPQADGSSGGNAELGWKHYLARPYTAGVFFWTGFDYRGEATPFGFPAISSQFGILDTCGFPKDSFYYLKSWWSDEPVLHLSPHWNWPDRVGEAMTVRADSNCEEVELWLNGASLGRKKVEPNSPVSWKTNYTPGTLEARGYRGGKEVLTARVETTGAPAKLSLEGDRREITADGRDVFVVTVAARDAQGRIVPTAGVPVSFDISGPGRIIGVGNGDPSCLEPDVFVDSSTAIPIGDWEAPNPAPSTEPVIFSATFDLPTSGDKFDLLLNSLGTKQTVYLNGDVLYNEAAPAQSRTVIPLDLDKLRPTGNEIRIEATRFESWSDREGLKQFHPASLRSVTPAAYWRRSTFNGLAQVIVQSNGEKGDIVLSAFSKGLEKATVSATAVPEKL